MTLSAANTRYIVRRAQATDIEVVMQLAEMAATAARWPRAAYDAYCMAAEDEIQKKVLFVASVTKPRDSVTERAVGFAAFSAVTTADGGECQLENMAVAPAWRRQGVGGRLLAAGLLWRRAWCPAATGIPSDRDLWLEVRASNHGAIAFYEHAGFTIAGRRPAYYASPVDDAILMRKG